MILELLVQIVLPSLHMCNGRSSKVTHLTGTGLVKNLRVLDYFYGIGTKKV